MTVDDRSLGDELITGILAYETMNATIAKIMPEHKSEKRMCTRYNISTQTYNSRTISAHKHTTVSVLEVRYGMVWCGEGWYGMVKGGMVWYGMV